MIQTNHRRAKEDPQKVLDALQLDADSGALADEVIREREGIATRIVRTPTASLRDR
jgi:hypothetical protein